ncbi:MAG: hypothetical protein IJZ16_00610 [Clostridia bacterium]|nr:hypothetical protein [Clostridia bacterium]
MQNAERLPLTREVAKSLILTEGEKVLLLTKSLPQSATQTAPSSEGAKEKAIKRAQQIIIYTSYHCFEIFFQNIQFTFSLLYSIILLIILAGKIGWILNERQQKNIS